MLERCTGPETAVEIIRPLFNGAGRKMVAVLSLDSKGYPIAAEVVAVGSLDCCIVNMRERLGIPLMEHIVLRNTGFVSLKDRGCGNLWANAP